MNNITMGISTNTRLVSVAIISQNELLEYVTHLYKATWSPKKQKEIIASFSPFLQKYIITRVVVSLPYAYHQTNAHKKLMQAIEAFFVKQSIQVFFKTPKAFDAFLEEGTKKKKKEMMKSLAVKFPELRRCYLREIGNRNKYYYKLFEAVAVAVLGDTDIL